MATQHHLLGYVPTYAGRHEEGRQYSRNNIVTAADGMTLYIATADTTTETPGPEATDWATLLTTPAHMQNVALASGTSGAWKEVQAPTTNKITLGFEDTLAFWGNKKSAIMTVQLPTQAEMILEARRRGIIPDSAMWPFCFEVKLVIISPPGVSFQVHFLTDDLAPIRTETRYEQLPDDSQEALLTIDNLFITRFSILYTALDDAFNTNEHGLTMPVPWNIFITQTN